MLESRTDVVERPIASTLVEFAILPPRARFVLRLPPDVLTDVLADHRELAGFDLDMPINRFTGSGDRQALRLGPDEWLLVGTPAEAAAIAADCSAALTGRHHALVDIGHRLTAFSIGGDAAADVINAGCPLDLDIRAFPEGSATRTLLGKAEIILARRDGTRFELACARSFADYLHGFLEEAAREFL